MKRISLIFIMTAIIGFAFISCANAWPFYSKPAFRGRVIDAETKKPIEGAVVVVLYYKRYLVGNPGGPNSYVFKAKETLTDDKGNFYISSYTNSLSFIKLIWYPSGNNSWRRSLYEIYNFSEPPRSR